MTLSVRPILLFLALTPAFSQAPAFEAADVHISNVSPTNFNLDVQGPFVHSGVYSVRTATMLDLIGIAYGVKEERILGGPSWLAMDRYDVTAKYPAGSTAESHRQMLQALLADRFHLVVHQDTKPLPAYSLTAGKHPQLKESSATPEQHGCKSKPRPQNVEPGTIVQIEVECHGLTMTDFAEEVHDMAGGYLTRPVVDQTGLKGAYDFDLKWTGRGRLAAAGAEGISIFDAVDKQLGLKLELGQIPSPVLYVDGAKEKPTDNVPNISALLPDTAIPTEFEVASIKPTPPEFRGMTFDVKPSGQLDVRGMNMKFIIQQAFQTFSDDMVVGLPKWAEQDRFDLIAKIPQALINSADPKDLRVDFDAVMVMVKNLLKERFQLETHMEERPVSAYTLVAAKPKMKAAEPGGRTACNEGPPAGARDPRDTNPILGRLITCQNMTMSRFADMLQSLASGYIHAPVLDNTGLEGAWDFTLNFSGAGALNGGGNREGGAPSATVTTAAASDPNGALSLLDALPKQLGLKLELSKRPVKVLVIDHIAQKPTEN